jgi:hypothetical protein
MEATPLEWSKFTSASIAIKTRRDKKPEVLHKILQRTYYSERRNVGRGLFFDSSRTKQGQQSIQNRLPHIVLIREPWNEKGQQLNNDALRVMLKKTNFSCKAQLVVS